jgi:hypothetical protein
MPFGRTAEQQQEGLSALTSLSADQVVNKYKMAKHSSLHQSGSDQAGHDVTLVDVYGGV